MTVKELKQELENWDDDVIAKLYIPDCPKRLAPLGTYPFEIDKPVLLLKYDYIYKGEQIICDQCGREILTDYINVEGYGVFCDDDCLADALLHDVKDGGGNYEEIEYEK